jgi:hypothetical protein
VAWQRKTPFGFAVCDGQTVVNPAEAYAVRDIFRRYISGEGYQVIADAMVNCGVRYHADKPEWNKHMVKRILENGKYIGNIITADEFERVQALQSSKTASYREPSDAERVIREKLTNASGIRVCDVAAELETRVAALLNELIANPDLLITEPLDKPLPNSETLRLQNELNRELTKPDFDSDRAAALVFALTAEKYAALPNVTQNRELAELQAELALREPLTEFDADLFSRAAKSIALNADGELELTLIGGAKLIEHIEVIEKAEMEETYGLRFA